MELLTLIIASVLGSNIVLVRFLGICPFLGVSKNTNNAVGMGLAATFVVFFSSLLSFGLYHLVLVPLGLEYLALLSFILIIAAFVQFVEMFFKKYIPVLYKAWASICR
jgi:electron transport complex protein RnfA